MPRLRMTIASRKIASLGGNHDLILRHSSHVEGLIGAGAGGENIRPGAVKNIEQPFPQGSSIGSPARWDNLETHAGVDFAVLKIACEDANIFDASPGATAHLRDVHGNVQPLLHRLDVAYGGGTRDLGFDGADINAENFLVGRSRIIERHCKVRRAGERLR